MRMKMRSVRTMRVLAACVTLAAGVLAAQGPPKESPKPESRPNFTGTWVMNAGKSDWGGLETPDILRYVIRHNGGNLVLVSTQDSTSKRMEMSTDGQERLTEEDAESEIWARLYWDGKTLVWEGRRKAKPAHQVQPVRWTSRWSLSEDGKRLLVKRQITFAQGTVAQSLVLDKK